MDTTPHPALDRRERLSRGHWLRWVPLILAVLWAIPSTIIGVNMITDQPSGEVSVDAPAPKLTSSAEELAYGGDAYTGIQNATAETEKAVVDGVNKLGAFQLELQRSAAQAQAQQAASAQARIEDGIGWLLIALAVVNLTVAVSRLAPPRLTA